MANAIITNATAKIARDVNQDGYADIVTLRFDLDESQKIKAASVTDVEYGTKVAGEFKRLEDPVFRNGNALFQKGIRAQIGDDRQSTSPIEAILLRVEWRLDNPKKFVDLEEVIINGAKVYVDILVEIKLKAWPELHNIDGMQPVDNIKLTN